MSVLLSGGITSASSTINAPPKSAAVAKRPPVPGSTLTRRCRQLSLSLSR